MHYGDPTKTREGWARNLLDEFKSNVETLKGAVREQQGPTPAHGSPEHGKNKHSDTCCMLIGVFFRVYIFVAHMQHIIPLDFLSSSVP